MGAIDISMQNMVGVNRAHGALLQKHRRLQPAANSSAITTASSRPACAG